MTPPKCIELGCNRTREHYYRKSPKTGQLEKRYRKRCPKHDAAPRRENQAAREREAALAKFTRRRREEAKRGAAEWRWEQKYLPLIEDNYGLTGGKVDPEWDLETLKASLHASENGGAGHPDRVARAVAMAEATGRRKR